ncbi:MAG: hypothetical protein Tsb005_08450 [Gammaproteobacteria bacterium]
MFPTKEDLINCIEPRNYKQKMRYTADAEKKQKQNLYVESCLSTIEELGLIIHDAKKQIQLSKDKENTKKLLWDKIFEKALIDRQQLEIDKKNPNAYINPEYSFLLGMLLAEAWRYDCDKLDISPLDLKIENFKHMFDYMDIIKKDSFKVYFKEELDRYKSKRESIGVNT